MSISSTGHVNPFFLPAPGAVPGGYTVGTSPNAINTLNAVNGVLAASSMSAVSGWDELARLGVLYNAGAFFTNFDTDDTIKTVAERFYGSIKNCQTLRADYAAHRIYDQTHEIAYFLRSSARTMLGVYRKPPPHQANLLAQLDLLYASGLNRITLTFLLPPT